MAKKEKPKSKAQEDTETLIKKALVTPKSKKKTKK